MLAVISLITEEITVLFYIIRMMIRSIFLVFFFLSFSHQNLVAQRFSLQEATCSEAFSLYLGDAELPVFSVSSERPFLTIAKGEEQVKYKMASFHFKDKQKAACYDPHIHTIDRSAKQIDIKGHFGDCDCDFELCFSLEEDASVRLHLALSDTTYNRINLRFKSTADERIYGLGEQFSHVEFKGKKPFMFTEENGLGRGDKKITGLAKLAGASGNEYTSYFPIPFFMTNKNRGLSLHNTQYSAFDFSNDNSIQVELWHHVLEAQLYNGNAPLDILETYTAQTGRFHPLPDWAYGTWMGMQGGSEKAHKIVKEAKAAGNPIRAIWIQDWVGKRKTRFGSQLWWHWEPHEESYPNFKQFCADMNAQDVKVLGYINSFLANEGSLCEHAIEKGYFVKNEKGEDYLLATAGFPAYLVDLTNPEAFEWLKGIIKTNMIDNGLSGWMADFAEWLPYDAVLYNGADPKAYHNQYPVDWARLNREAIEEAGKLGEIVFFMRSGFTGSSKYSTLFWMGDQMTSWGKHDGFGSTMNALLSSSLSGISYNHSDVGGYTNVNIPFFKFSRSRELFYRWCEMNAFTSVYRTHEGLIPDKNIQPYTDAESIAVFAKFGKIHYKLKDYFKIFGELAAQKGQPVCRHTLLNYPDDVLAHRADEQFMVGTDLLVAPVLDEGAEEVRLYLPPGEWSHAFNGTRLSGGRWHTVAAPLGEPAVFILQGGEHEGVLEEAFEGIAD